MGNLIHARKIKEKKVVDRSAREQEELHSQAIVPTIDVYTAKIFFGLTKKMVEDTVDKRITALEKNIESRDQEVMRTIRRIQAQVTVQQTQISLPWWKKIFRKNKAR